MACFTMDTGERLLPRIPEHVAAEIEQRIKHVPRWVKADVRRREYEAAAIKLETAKLRQPWRRGDRS